MKEQNKKAVIYCRVSAQSQEDEGNGLESQETRCRQHANARGYDVAAVFPDTISGGGDFMKRPGMVALLSFLDAQPDEKFVVIFDDLKRFARDTRFHLDLREAFRCRGASIECLNFKFDDTPEGEFIETIMAAQGALERKQGGRQVAQKMRARMENGYWVHNAPVGYRYVPVKGRGKLLFPDPPLDAIVREAFEGYASGRFRSQAEVVRFLESFSDFPRNKKGKITQQRVADMFTQPVYTGYICSETYSLNWLKGQHEGLISLETYEKVQERRKGAALGPRRKNIGDAFALRGMVACACCNAPLRSSITKGNGGDYPYYLCQTKSCEAYGKSIPRDKIEGEVGALIKELEPTEGLITLATAMFQHAWNQRRDQAKEIIQSGKRQVKEIEKQIESLLERIMQSGNSAVIGTYEQKIGKLEHEKLLLAEKLQNQAEPKGTFEEKLEPVLQFLANPWKLWENGNITLRRTVLNLAFTAPIKYDRFEGPRTPEIALPFKALGGIPTMGVCYGAHGWN
ncbi:MAG: recombinase family protein [Pseudomonadota bacterium]